MRSLASVRAAAVPTLIGLGLILWIALELVLLPRVSGLEPVYAVIGLALLVLPAHPQVRRYLATPTRRPGAGGDTFPGGQGRMALPRRSRSS